MKEDVFSPIWGNPGEHEGVWEDEHPSDRVAEKRHQSEPRHTRLDTEVPSQERRKENKINKPDRQRELEKGREDEDELTGGRARKRHRSSSRQRREETGQRREGEASTTHSPDEAPAEKRKPTRPEKRTQRTKKGAE